MYLSTILTLFVLLGDCWALVGDRVIPSARSCQLHFGTVLKKHGWVCDTKETYPTARINSLLLDDVKYYDVNEYLRVTKGCYTLNDHDKISNENEYYSYESICKMIRHPIRLIWARVPDYIVPVKDQNLNGGLLPCHVLEGQSLFDVECVHPWAVPTNGKRHRIQFTGIKRNLCLAGYAYNYNLVCKPTGYMPREVLVYNEQANKIFSVVIPDVPTACACAQCLCNQSPAVV